MADIVLDEQQIRQKIHGNTDSPGGCVAEFMQAWNDGLGQSMNNNGAFCRRYMSVDANVKFDTGHVSLSDYTPPTAAGNYFSEWHVCCSPNDANGQWSCFLAEQDIGNRSSDMGYRGNIAGARTTGGIMMVATVPDSYKQGGHLGYNVDVAFVCSNGDPSREGGPQFYNGFMTHFDGLAENGRGVQLCGAQHKPATPFAPLEATYRWKSGIHMEHANILDNNAMVISTTQNISRTDGKIAVFLSRAQLTRLHQLLGD